MKKSYEHDSELSQIFKQTISEFRRQNQNSNTELAPLRGLDDFILTKSRFQIPNFNDEDRLFNRIVYNMMYYQTNYLLSALVIFALVFLYRPQEMFLGLFFMAFAFGLCSFFESKKVELRNFKRNHPLIMTLICFSVGYYMIYKLASVAVLLLGVILPIVFMLVHASLRMRNVMNKMTNA